MFVFLVRKSQLMKNPTFINFYTSNFGFWIFSNCLLTIKSIFGILIEKLTTIKLN